MPFPGVVVDNAVLDLRPTLGQDSTTRALLEDWDASLATLHELAEARPVDGVPLAELRPLPPVQSRQLLCAGANYFQHVREIAFSFRKNSGDARPDEEIRAEAEELTRRRHEVEDPFVFAGLTSAMCGAQDEIVLWGPGEQHDWELELAVVIGRAAREVRRDDAL